MSQKWHLCLLSEGSLTVYTSTVKLPVFMMKDGDCSRSSVSMFTNSNKLNKIRPLQDHEARSCQIPSTRLQRLRNFIWKNLLHVITLLASGILRWIVDKWKIFAPLLEAFQIVLLKPLFICIIRPQHPLALHYLQADKQFQIWLQRKPK